MNMNPVVAYLQKAPKEFTMEDIIKLIRFKSIQMVNFMYPGGDGKLKTLNFVITNEAYLRTILCCGERVDGSSLFDFIQASSSDLYVMPRESHALYALLFLRQRRPSTGECSRVYAAQGYHDAA